MTAPANTLAGDEYWLRCPACGDSLKHPTRAHLSVNVETGAFFCLRCNRAGRLSPAQILELTAPLVGVPRAKRPQTEFTPFPIPGPGSSRPSLLDRYHAVDVRDGATWDLFLSRNPAGQVVGYLLKRKGQALVYGKRGYLYPTPLGGGQTVLRVVEGPYDVHEPNDVAVGGLLRPWKVYNDLAPFRLILTPDGDVWTKPALLKSFLRGTQKVLKAGGLVGVEYLPEGKDPDEVPPLRRDFLSPRQVYKVIAAVLGGENDAQTFFGPGRARRGW